MLNGAFAKIDAMTKEDFEKVYKQFGYEANKDVPFNFDIEVLEASFNSGFNIVPTGLTLEEFKRWIVNPKAHLVEKLIE